MCLTLFAHKTVPGYALILANNRDEFHKRPTLPAHFGDNGMLAGIDLEGGGTWLGIARNGKIANLTNHRDFRIPLIENAPTRGTLVSQFIDSPLEGRPYLESLAPTAANYNGFSILVGTPEELHYYSNREGEIQKVAPGFHGFSNAFLDTPWPKVVEGGKQFKSILDQDPQQIDALFDLMHSTEVAPDDQLPDTGRNLEFERMVSPMFIDNPVYGTRCTTLIFITDEGQVSYHERSFDSTTQITGNKFFEFNL